MPSKRKNVDQRTKLHTKRTEENGNVKPGDGAGKNEFSTEIMKSLAVMSAVVVVTAVVYQYRDSVTNDLNSKSDKSPVFTSGGWRMADSNILDLYNSSICNIDRKFASEITSEEFETVYRYKKPIIIKFANCARDWIDPDQWTVDSLIKSYGQKWVLSGNAREIVRHGGSGYVETSFVEYIDKLMSNNDQIGEPL